ncbi:glutathione peroxidase [Salmonirosea aquatica]|uniref:Glutathione peroxidase n=1 Tax=Salmonirosea aquatica TaxID=2654236 RepID=A0A7C9BKE4_9BACT|nr:glutathione peroxidase [Cytophagaceae bacterium SJW1-29]
MSFIKITVLMFASLLSGFFVNKKETAMRPNEEIAAQKSLYDFKMKALIGDETIDLSQYKGKKVVLLNVASKCGFTPQYADWQKFHEQYGDKIVVLGFPANNFGGQEPGTEEEIATFCQKNYGVTFQMFDKIDVVGKSQHPLYQWLSTKELNGWNDKAPTWNFCKYVVNEKGELTHFFASAVKPTDAEFKQAVGL